MTCQHGIRAQDAHASPGPCSTRCRLGRTFAPVAARRRQMVAMAPRLAIPARASPREQAANEELGPAPLAALGGSRIDPWIETLRLLRSAPARGLQPAVTGAWTTTHIARLRRLGLFRLGCLGGFRGLGGGPLALDAARGAAGDGVALWNGDPAPVRAHGCSRAANVCNIVLRWSEQANVQPWSRGDVYLEGLSCTIRLVLATPVIGALAGLVIWSWNTTPRQMSSLPNSPEHSIPVWSSGTRQTTGQVAA